MRDPEERTRHFVVGEKRKTNLDEPAVRRKVVRTYGAEGLRDSDEQPARPPFPGQRNEDGASMSGRAVRKRQIPDYEEEDDVEDRRGKAPILVRVFAWASLLAVFFACGYLGANYIFNWADKKGGPRVGDVVGSPAEIKQTDASTASQGETVTSGYSIYLPDNGKYTKREIDIAKGTVEADAAKVISVYIDGLKETNTLDSSTRALNVFIGGDCMYLDMSSQFLASLKKLGAAKAPSVLSGMAKTVTENFPPVKKIKFYIDGKESNITSPADLTKPWEKTE